MKTPLWYPYTQHKTMDPPLKVSHAKNSTLYLENGTALIDGISSWWCTIHGYSHPELTQTIATQAQQLSHIMLGGLTHDPAQKLAQKLVDITPDGLNHVFFSDSGSIGMEVAMKMAIQYHKNKSHSGKTKFIALKKSYHGDTCGVISIGDPEDGMHASFASAFPKQFFVDSPTSGFHPKQAQLKKEITKIEALIAKNHTKIAAFVVEPIMQGAGGFNLYSGDYLNHISALCKAYNILLIFDEVATGFGRTGTLFAANHTQITPDILVLGKALTGGMIGHAATITTSDVFNAFYSSIETHAFMHGPTFMANPLACAVALKSIEIFERDQYLDKISKIHTQLTDELGQITSKAIKDIRTLGGLGVIEVHDASQLKGIQKFAIEHGVWLRPFSNVVYTTPPYIIKSDELTKITQVLNQFFKVKS